MKIAVDAMGGDYAPLETVKGAARASSSVNGKIILVGDSTEINRILSGCEYNKEAIEVIHTTEVITNNDKPTSAIRKKKNSSLVKCFNLVQSGEADGIVSAGSTGALLAGSVHFLKRLSGVSRPALSPLLPSAKNGFIIVDGGANTNSRPNNLLQFAIMGSVYMEKVMGRKNPRVGLLNIGSEDEKGTDLTRAAYELISQSGLNFIGNVEGRDPIAGICDVVVCDGFAGNILLKATEGAGSVLFSSIKDILMGSPLSKIAAVFLKKGLYELKRKYDYKEYGGAPFLGVSGCVIKAHGTSDAHSIASAIKQAFDFAKSGALSDMEKQIKNKGGAGIDI